VISGVVTLAWAARGILEPPGDCQQFGFAEAMDADGPVPEARSEASHVPFSLVMTAVRSGREGPRWMTTVTLPFPPATADNTFGAFFQDVKHRRDVELLKSVGQLGGTFGIQGHPSTITACTSPGPCTPRVSVISMSALREGPVTSTTCDGGPSGQ